MKFKIFLFLLLLSFQHAYAQKAEVDYGWWNTIHDWQPGDPGWREMMIISPGYFGPNALPVPEVKKGVLQENLELALTASNHFHSGDPTQDISGKIYIPFAKNKIAVEMYGVALEHFAFSEEIRNKRISRIEDGKGFAIGDFYFSTLIQISKNRKFPNTLFRFTTKTASGNQLEGARFTDTPGYFLDFSFSKDYGNETTGLYRPFALLGFYSWQTNDWLNLQNDALMFAFGADYQIRDFLVSGSFSGYAGYKEEIDRPLQFNIDLRKDFDKKTIRLQYEHGLQHREYKTLRFSFIWKFKSSE